MYYIRKQIKGVNYKLNKKNYGEGMRYLFSLSKNTGYTFILDMAVILHFIALMMFIHAEKSIFNEVLFWNFGLEEGLVVTLDKLLIYFVFFLAIFFLQYNRWGTYFIVFSYVFTYTVLLFMYGADLYRSFIPFSHCSRYLLPFVLFYINFRTKVFPFQSILLWAVACVFLSHGIEAFLIKPQFVDIILGFASKLNIASLNENTVNSILLVIAGLDILVALSVFLIPNKLSLLYMTIWGLVTALSRFWYFELWWEASAEFFLRSSHFLIPCYILLTHKSVFLYHNLKIDILAYFRRKRYVP